MRTWRAIVMYGLACAGPLGRSRPLPRLRSNRIPHALVDDREQGGQVEGLFDARVGDAVEEGAHLRREHAARHEDETLEHLGREGSELAMEVGPARERHQEVAEDDVEGRLTSDV